MPAGYGKPRATSSGAELADVAANEAASLKAQLDQMKSLKPDQLRVFVQQNHSNPVLTKLFENLADAKQKLVELSVSYTPDNLVYKGGVSLIETINQQIDEQIQGVLLGLSIKQNIAEEQAKALRAQASQRNSPTSAEREGQKELVQKQIALAEQDSGDVKKKFEHGQATQADIRAAEREVLRLRQQLAALDAPVKLDSLQELSIPDDEEKEIRRIQAMIQNSPDLINADSGGTPLGKAASAGWLRVAAFLLDHGAAVNLKSGGAPPVAIAASSGNKAMTELLLDRGADVNATDGGGRTALHTAVVLRFRSVAEVLLSRKADVNARDSERNGRCTPLHLAAQGESTEMVALLLANKADVNARDKTDWTPLHWAASAKRAENIKLLLAKGAEVNARDKADRT
ncbi:MAG TPA: ankyrin repeat domain-containing protein, partial [Candidatus Paceibacterota bacterium]|nr:ankyrin repeat domain-containing protein [Candidatus Paceibacterota bacterium]